MRKLMILLALLMLGLPLCAGAATEMTIVPRDKAFDYDVQTTDAWIRLVWKSQNEDGMKTLYAPDGHFTGTIDLRCGAAGGSYTVTVQNLRLDAIAKKTVKIPPSADYVAPSGTTNVAVEQLRLTETATGFRYSFEAPGSDYMMLRYYTVQEDVCFPVYPVNDAGLYEGEIVAPLTYARTLFTVQVQSASGRVRREGTVRKGYEAPEAAAQQPGRLSGVVVCIDPGHQENGRVTTEPLGPGLSGSVKSSGGMAQGTKTLRREAIVVLETGMILRDLLLKEGATVVMTREKQDDYRSNLERCEIAEEAGAHILLRLHCDGNENKNKTGMSIWAPRNSDYARAVAAPEEYRLIAQLFLDEMKKSVGYEVTDKTGLVYTNDKFVGNNWAKMVCFLVEMGFLTNIGEDIKLATPEYQTMLAQGMVEGVYQVALHRGWITEEE